MSRKVRKLTPTSLKRMIQEEARKLQTELTDPVEKGGDIEKVEAEVPWIEIAQAIKDSINE